MFFTVCRFVLMSGAFPERKIMPHLENFLFRFVTRKDSSTGFLNFLSHKSRSHTTKFIAINESNLKRKENKDSKLQAAALVAAPTANLKAIS